MKPWPQLYDSANGLRKGILDDAYDVIVTDQMLDASGGEEILDFNMPLASAKALLIDNEMVVRITEPGYIGSAAPVSAFVVRTKTEARDNTGNKTLAIHAEALWYDLGAADAKTYTPGSTNPTTAMTAILVGTGWTVGTITVGVSGQPFTLVTATNPLAALRAMPGIFGGELWFDNIAKTVNLVTSRGNPTSGLFFAYGKNLASSSRIADTAQLVTRLRPVGAAGLDISLVNSGVTYIDDYTFYDSRGWPRQIKSEVLINDQITTGAALLTWGQAQLATLNKPKITYTLDVIVLNTESMPALGDTVRVWDKPIALDTNARVAQRTLNIMEPFRSTLQLNTALYTLANAVGGAVQSTGTTIGVAAPDTVVPAAVTGVSASTVDSIDQNGKHTERLLVSWNQTTLNVDSTPFNDFDHYALQMVLNGNGIVIPIGAIVSQSVVQALTGIVPGGATFVVSVQAVDHAGNYGAAGTFTGTVANPTNPPPPPSTPTIDNTSLPLTIRVGWDGLSNVGAAMPSDFRYVEVHASVTNGFTPSAATRMDSLTGAGVAPLMGFTAGTAVYVLLRAVGSTGLSSTSSVVVSIAPALIGTNNIGSVQITDALIGNVSVGKLVAGTLIADVTLSARIKTANTGARVELSSAGLQAFDSVGTPTVSISAIDGSASFTGTITGSTITGGTVQTAANILGNGRVVMGNAFSAGVFFYAPNAPTATDNAAFIWSDNDPSRSGYSKLHITTGGNVVSLLAESEIAISQSSIYMYCRGTGALGTAGPITLETSALIVKDATTEVLRTALTGTSIKNLPLFFREIADANHTAYWDSGIDGLIVRGRNTLQLEYSIMPSSSTGSAPSGVRIGQISNTSARLIHTGSAGNFHVDAVVGALYVNWYAGANLHLGNGAGANGTYYGVGTINTSGASIKTDIESMTVAPMAIKPVSGKTKADTDLIPVGAGAKGYGLAAIKQLRPVRFRYQGNNAVAQQDDRQHLGFVAEEMALIFPEVVYDVPQIDAPSIKGINYSQLIPILYTAIQELSDKVDALGKKAP